MLNVECRMWNGEWGISNDELGMGNVELLWVKR